MLGITLSDDEIKTAPSDVRRWLEQQVTSTFAPVRIPPNTVRSATEMPSPEKEPLPQGGAKMSSKQAPTRDEEVRHLIAVRAYELWENQGRPSGHDLINWREAEQEIMSCIGNGSGREAAEPKTDRLSPGLQTKQPDISAVPQAARKAL
jgi:hypothetical protein